MWRSFRVGSLFGIPIKLDLTFLLILPVFAWLIGAGVEPVTEILNALGGDIALEEVAGSPTQWILGFVAAVGLFVGVLLHELGHSLVARRLGYPIDSITLWLFGGLARLTEFPEDWRQEFAIAIAGPIVSVAIGVLGYLAFLAVPSNLDAVAFVVGYLGVLNVALAGFNMLPAFPMDGGRILRALLARKRSFVRATEIAAKVGKLFAFLFGLFGLFQLDFILVGIAIFIYIAATSEARQVTMKAAFEGISVGEVMTPAARLRTVESNTSVADLLERMFRERHTGYPVVENGHPVGVVTLEDAKAVDPLERHAFTVADVMSRDPVTIGADEGAGDALSRMQSQKVGRLLVMRDGVFAGLLSQTDLMRVLDVVQSTSMNREGRAGGPEAGLETGPGAGSEPEPEGGWKRDPDGGPGTDPESGQDRPPFERGP